MEAGGDLKRAKLVLFSSGLMYSHNIAPIYHAATVAQFYRQALMSAYSGSEDM